MKQNHKQEWNCCKGYDANYRCWRSPDAQGEEHRSVPWLQRPAIRVPLDRRVIRGRAIFPDLPSPPPLATIPGRAEGHDDCQHTRLRLQQKISQFYFSAFF